MYCWAWIYGQRFFLLVPWQQVQFRRAEAYPDILTQRLKLWECAWFNKGFRSALYLLVRYMLIEHMSSLSMQHAYCWPRPIVATPTWSSQRTTRHISYVTYVLKNTCSLLTISFCKLRVNGHTTQHATYVTQQTALFIWTPGRVLYLQMLLNFAHNGCLATPPLLLVLGLWCTWHAAQFRTASMVYQTWCWESVRAL